MKKATRQQTKQHNTRLVLRTIYESEPASRADVARATRLTRPTVSTIVAELLGDGLVAEIGTAPSSGGKPATLLAVPPNARHVLCLDIGGDQYRGALINLRGEVCDMVTVSAESLTHTAALDRLLALAATLRDRAGAPLLGAAVGSPGVIDPGAGVVRHAVNLGWQDVPLRARLAAVVDAPIYIANDSQAAALGEYTFGPQLPSANLLLLNIGRGIGAGIVIGGQLFYGDGFAAGEIGQVVVAENGTARTLEAVASTRALLAAAAAATGAPVTWDAFVAAVQAGDPALTGVVAAAGYHVGVALAHLIAAFNIRRIVLAGPVPQLGPALRAAAQATARRWALPEMVDETELVDAALGDHSVLLGCAALVCKQELGLT